MCGLAGAILRALAGALVIFVVAALVGLLLLLGLDRISGPPHFAAAATDWLGMIRFAFWPIGAALVIGTVIRACLTYRPASAPNRAVVLVETVEMVAVARSAAAPRSRLSARPSPALLSPSLPPRWISGRS